MIAFVLTALFVAVVLAVSASLTDSALRWSHAFKSLQREHALAKAGFVPVVSASELRLRPSGSAYRGAPSRNFARRLPRPTGFQPQDASAA